MKALSAPGCERKPSYTDKSYNGPAHALSTIGHMLTTYRFYVVMMPFPVPVQVKMYTRGVYAAFVRRDYIG